MADTKVSALTELTVAPDPTDELVVVDKSDTTMAASGTDKRLQFQNLFPLWGPVASVPAGPVASFATGGANTYYALRVLVLSKVTLTGVRYRVGTGAAAGNVFSSLYDAFGARVVSAAGALAQATAQTVQNVPFTTTYAAVPGLYYALLRLSSAAATTFGGRFLVEVATGTDTGTPTSISPAVTNSDIAVMTVY